MPEIYCKECGNIVQPTDPFCRICGASLGSKPLPEKPAQSDQPEQSIAGLDCMSDVNCLGPLAIVTGAISLLQIKKQGNKGRAAAIPGIVLGTLQLLITLIATMLLLVM